MNTETSLLPSEPMFRQVVDASAGTSMASGDNDDTLVVRTIVCAPDSIDTAPMESWEMTEDGTPFFKSITTDYIDPRDMWGKYWPYRTTLIRKHQGGQSTHGTVVEVSAKFHGQACSFWDDRPVFAYDWFRGRM